MCGKSGAGLRPSAPRQAAHVVDRLSTRAASPAWTGREAASSSAARQESLPKAFIVSLLRLGVVGRKIGHVLIAQTSGDRHHARVIARTVTIGLQGLDDVLRMLSAKQW